MSEDQASGHRPGSPGRPCSVAATLNLVGEKWALLAIREITFGNRRFDQIARNTGAPRDRLAARLRSLEAAGVIARHQYSDHPPRYEYELTQSGEDLRPVLMALRAWGDTWAVDAPPVTFTHSCGHDVDAVMTCRHCGGEIEPRDLKLRVQAPGWDRKGPVPSDPRAAVLREPGSYASPGLTRAPRRRRSRSRGTPLAAPVRSSSAG
ncbi:MAG TPA: helix-turn-helix domain-containing protein [Trebonia sp.]